METLRQESAASQAFRIPHIVTAVFRFSRDESRSKETNDTLLACTLVNRLFEDEANRLLWEKCSNTHSYEDCPSLEHLAKMKPLSRLQKYANYIREISIDAYYSKDFEYKREMSGSYLTGLSHVSFPRLEALFLMAPRYEVSNHPLPSVGFLAQPNLKTLHIDVSNGNRFAISEEFLQQLQQNSTGLRHITVSEEGPLDNKWKSFSSETISSFLQAFPSLETVHWNLDGTIDEPAFRILSRCTELKSLSIYCIYGSWLQNVEPESAFPALKYLECCMSSQALSLAVPFLEQIQYLRIWEITGMPGNAWKEIAYARFEHLISLELHLNPSTVLHGDEILSVAHCSPELQNLHIRPSMELGYRPFAIENFTNETIRDLAKQLPALTILKLNGYSTTSIISEDSLISLAKHCPLLTACALHATIDWESLTKNTSVQAWPSLRSLIIGPSFGLGGGEVADDNEGTSDDLAKAVLQRMPRLQPNAFNLIGAPNLQHAIRKASHSKSWQI